MSEANLAHEWARLDAIEQAARALMDAEDALWQAASGDDAASERFSEAILRVRAALAVKP